MAKATLEQRFWSKVRKTETCWLWTGAKTDGYGQFNAGARKFVRAYRFAYELLVGPVPEGLELDHVKANGCTSRACVKAIADEYGPAHLEPVTHAENVERGEMRQRLRESRAAKTHCPQGHPYDEVNTYWWQAKRHCRTCRRQRKLAPRSSPRR